MNYEVPLVDLLRHGPCVLLVMHYELGNNKCTVIIKLGVKTKAMMLNH